MARIFTSGFELQSAANGVEWSTSDIVPELGAINTDGSHVRSGLASLRLEDATRAQVKGVVTRFTPVANGQDLFGRVYIKIATAPDQETSFIGLGTALEMNTVRVVLTPSRTLQLHLDSGSSLEQLNGSTVLATGTWYRIEFRFRRHATSPNAGLDHAELRLDGNPEVVSESLSIISTPSRFAVGANLNAEAATTCDYYLDDAALNDSTGSDQLSWPGEGRVVVLVPDAEGDFAQTLTLAGTAPEATHWESLDDLPIGAADGEDFVTFTAAASNWTGSGSRLAVEMGAMPATPGAIALVAVGARVRNLSSSSSAYVLSAQISDGGTKATDRTVSFGHTTDWLLNSALSTRAAAPYTLYRDPDGDVWTETTVNALQVLMRGSDVTPNFSVTALWATVEYADAEAPGTPGGPGGLLLLGVG